MNISRFKRFIKKKFVENIASDYTYHTWDHVMNVLDVCNQYIKRYGISGNDAYLLRTAALVHDIGFLWSQASHEQKGVEYTLDILPDWGYSDSDIKIIDGLILATQIPQKPSTLLEQIICDADLDYLGTDKFYKIGETLFQEMKNLGHLSTRKEWNDLQIRFLKSHTYHTPYARKFREPTKQKHLQDLISEQ